MGWREWGWGCVNSTLPLDSRWGVTVCAAGEGEKPGADITRRVQMRTSRSGAAGGARHRFRSKWRWKRPAAFSDEENHERKPRLLLWKSTRHSPKATRNICFLGSEDLDERGRCQGGGLCLFRTLVVVGVITSELGSPQAKKAWLPTFLRV